MTLLFYLFNIFVRKVVSLSFFHNFCYHVQRYEKSANFQKIHTFFREFSLCLKVRSPCFFFPTTPYPSSQEEGPTKELPSFGRSEHKRTPLLREGGVRGGSEKQTKELPSFGSREFLSPPPVGGGWEGAAIPSFGKEGLGVVAKNKEKGVRDGSEKQKNYS